MRSFQAYTIYILIWSHDFTPSFPLMVLYYCVGIAWGVQCVLRGRIFCLVFSCQISRMQHNSLICTCNSSAHCVWEEFESPVFPNDIRRPPAILLYSYIVSLHPKGSFQCRDPSSLFSIEFWPKWGSSSWGTLSHTQVSSSIHQRSLILTEAEKRVNGIETDLCRTWFQQHPAARSIYLRLENKPKKWKYSCGICQMIP